MVELRNPYISKVQIKNFRNFLDVDVSLDQKQVIIGENNTGKTNFLRAIQLILDKNFSDTDRELNPEDFHDSIESPMDNGAEIEIKLYIKGYKHNRKLVAQFADAVISDTPPTLQFTYKYFPNLDENKHILNYRFLIYKGNNEEARFTNEDRNYINIYVIKALRDVERELKANKNSPLYKLVKQYEILPEQLQDISEELKQAAEGILELDEIIHIKDALNNQFAIISGLQKDNEITLRTFDIDTERLLYTLQVYMGLKERPVTELSLGLANLLYISLMLLLLKDRTILPIIKAELFESLLEKDKSDLLKSTYQKSDKGNYILNKQISSNDFESLYEFMDEYNFKSQPFTILAVEEPEAHLHPVLQRLIYREVLHNSSTSVVFTSHSTHIASVSPLNSIVYVRHCKGASQIFSTVGLNLTKRESKDIERYIDAKRGEIYFGKAIILTEGITEEYLVPTAAKLLSSQLDDYGIVVCNVNSTNFKPYVQLLNSLNIPWIIFTDGDYYEITTVKNKLGKEKKERFYHIMQTETGGYYQGNENIKKLLLDLDILNDDEVPNDYNAQDELFRKHGCFIGKYTFEVDMMDTADPKGIQIIKNIFKRLKPGGDEMQQNFEDAIDDKDYWSALNKIDNYISKGRFAQRLSGELVPQLIPNYIENGIVEIIKKVQQSYE